MEFTGERFVPDVKGIEQLALEHLHRYYSVKDLVQDKVVLDIACGTGYGSALLAEEARYVYGVDISQEAIQYCRDNYVRSNLKYVEGSVENIPLDDKSVDVIISYETIEHIDETLQYKFRDEIKRVLKEDGILIISTPNKYVYSDIPKYQNEFHIKEFYKDEFVDFLKGIFNNVKIYNQGLQICDVIENQEEKNVKEIALNDSNNKNLYQYMIAVCSDQNLVNIDLTSTVIDKDNLLFLILSKYNDINRMLSGDNEKYTAKNIIEQKENYINEQREIIEQKESYIVEQRGIIEQKENYIVEQRGIIEQKENYIVEQRGIIEQKENYIVEQRGIIEQKENYIVEQRGIIEQKESYIVEQRGIIEQKENYIAEQREVINSKEQELELIKQSKYYKVYSMIKEKIRGKAK